MPLLEPLVLTEPEGWLEPPARRVESPNHDARPDGCGIDAVILHAISLPPRQYGGGHVERFFCNRLVREIHPYFEGIASLRVSSHFLIDRAGRVVQFVPVARRAWHAGVSHCLGRDRVNDFSVGIELEGCDDESFTRSQYDTLAALILGLRRDYPHLGNDRLFGHSAIAPGRKTDPGPFFDWNGLRERLRG